jgi:glutaminase
MNGVFICNICHQPTNPHWARVVYGPFSLCVIHKEGLCLSSGDINRLMMMTSVSSLCTKPYCCYYLSR